MLHDALHRLHLVERHRLCCPLEVKEIANEDRLLLAVNKRSPLLELLVTAQTSGKLQRGNSVRVPRVLYAVFAPREEAVVF